MKVFNLPVLGGETANHFNFMQHILVLYSSCYLALQMVILEKCQNINFCKLVWAGVYAILICKPVQTSFQVDIEIYQDKLSQSEDRILSSHITKGQ